MKLSPREYMHTALDGNLNTATLTPFAIQELMQAYADHVNKDRKELSIEVSIWEKAGKFELYNHTTQRKLEVETYQPWQYALHKARKLAEILQCDLNINGEPDDGRVVEVNTLTVREVNEM